MRRHKYGAAKAECAAGHTHASKREATRCDELHLLLHARKIWNLQFQRQFYFVVNGEQVKHQNGRRVGINIDFTYTDENGDLIAEDSKGYRVRDWPLRSALFRALYPGWTLREV